MVNDLWFNPNRYAWLPGTAYGVLAILASMLVITMAPKGRARRFIYGLWTSIWLVALALLAAGILALVRNQPWGVWYALVLPGSVGIIVVGSTSIAVRKQYRSRGNSAPR
jgi:MFS family permease